MASVRDSVAAVDLDVAADLARVEALLHDVARSDHELVATAATLLLDAGGKRLRPALVLTCGALGDRTDPRLVPCAAAIELTHLATLYHDDVMDETALRRGVPTVNARYGNAVAVLTGDLLFARASALAADLGPYVSKTLADTIAELCEGQIAETEHTGRLDTTAEAYFGIIDRKSAALMATSCHLGAWLGGSEPAAVESATRYGRALGTAFQLSDDVIDVAGSADQTGKEPGTDLREGVLTLPAIETLAGRAPGAGELRSALEGGDVAGALDLLAHNGSIELARRTVDEWVERARGALGPLAATPARAALDELALLVGRRTG